MERRIVRSYSFTDRDVREALIAWLKAKDMPAPIYVGDADTTKWKTEPAGISVEWTEQDEI